MHVVMTVLMDDLRHEDKTVNLLAEAFETKTVFDDDAFARVNQSSYELLSTLLVRTEDAASATVRQALRRAVGLTVRTAGRSDGSTLVDSLTLCMLSAAPHLEIAACQFMDLAITDASEVPQTIGEIYQVHTSL